MSASAMPEELPQFSIRVSSRAKHVRLTVTARDGLVVVVPKRWRGDPAAIVASKREWAEQALASVAETRALHAGGAEALLPSLIEFAATGELWVVEYRSTPVETTRVIERDATLTVSGNVEDADACLAALRRWLDRAARARLVPRVETLAAEHALKPSRVRVRHARSRWGSCSSRGSVSLSRNVVFMPAELADALVLHELAHLRHMDHSPRFWAALAELDPHVVQHRERLKQAAGFVPAWADA